MRALLTAILLFSSCAASATDLGCSSPDNWAANSAFAQLKNAGLVTNNDIDFKKTKVFLIAQSKIGMNLYQQVHRIDFISTSGKSIAVITSNKASKDECSMGAVDVYVISQKLGN